MIGLRTSLCRWSTLLALAAVSLALPALAGDDPAAAAPPEQAVAQAPAEAAPAVGVAGMVAFIDPETGRLSSTPTEAQRAELRAMLADRMNDSYEGLVEVAMPDGSYMIDLQGRFQDLAVVLVAPDGTRHFECVNSVPQASGAPPAAVAPAPPAAAAVE